MSLFGRLVALSSNRKFYFRMLTAYALFTVGMVAFSSLVLVAYARAFLREEIEASTRHVLAQAQILIDRSVVHQAHSIVNREFLNPATSGPISDFFAARSEKASLYYKAANAASEIALNSEFVDSVYLYRRSDDTLVASEGGVTFNVSSRRGISPFPINVDILGRARDQRFGKRWISPVENTGFPAARPMLSFVRAIPLYSSDADRAGYFILNLAETAIADAVRSGHRSGKTDFLVVDSEGRVLIHAGSGQASEPAGPELLELVRDRSGFTVTQVGSRNTAVSWLESSVADWTYVSLIPVESLNERLLVLRKMAAIVVSVAIALTIIVLVPLTLRLYTPLRRIVDSTRRRLHVESVAVSDIDFIDEAISGLIRRVGEMEESLKENERLIEHKMIADIVLGNVRDPDAILRRLGYLGLRPLPTTFGLVLIDLDRRSFRRLRYGPREFLSLQTADLVTELFDQKARSFSYDPGRIAAVITTADELDAANMRTLLDQLRSKLGIRANLCWCELVLPPAQIANAFETMRRFTAYAYIHGYGNVFSRSELEAMEGNELEMSHRELARAEAMLRGGRIDDFSRLVHDVVREIRDRKLSYDSSVAGLNQLAALTLSTFREMEVDVDASCGDSTNTPVTSDEDIGSHADGLVDTASVLFDQVRRRVGTVDGEFVHRIADYIEETVGRETNLSRIAEEFGISAGHLSRIFKEGTGESFSEFVIRQKLRKAAEILKVDAQCEIALLAYRMGYDDPSYFSRIFRRYYGMTPARYRKQHLTHQP